MSVEIRGIIRFKREGVEIRKIVTRGQRGDNYKWTAFPSDKPFNRGQIIKLIGETYGIPPGQVKIAPHVKIKEV